jgi:hypothetical protein
VAAPIDIAELRTRVQTAADMTIAAAGTFIITTELDQWIQDACKALYDKMVWARGEDYYAKFATYNLVAGTYYYNLPADFYRSLHLDAYLGNDHTPVPRFELKQISDLKAITSGASSIYELRYRIEPAQVEFRPTPQLTCAVDHFYIPTCADLTAGGITFDGINGWEEWAVLHAAICCLDKEESDSSALKQRLAMQEQRIQELASQRDAGMPYVVQDTRRDRSTHSRRNLSNDWNW